MLHCRCLTLLDIEMPSSLSTAGVYAALTGGAIAATYAGTYAYKSRLEKRFNDGIDLKNQTIEIDPVEHIRRCTFYKDTDLFEFHKTIYPTVKTLGDVFYHGYTESNNGPCIAFVHIENKNEPLHWISYSMALERIRRLGTHLWRHARLTPMKSRVAIISLNRPEYSLIEHACYMYGFTVLALYTTYDSATILSILERTQTEVLVVDNLDRIESFKDRLFASHHLKEILVMDDVKHEQHDKIQTMPTILQTMQQADILARPPIDPDSIATFILTSGTTGQ
jgi:non-ribosomal peptide synthetase component E (peptide arylation enzyme)